MEFSEAIKSVEDISLDELYHHGIKGQRWGIRRYQNSDGSLKPAGRKRYNDGADGIRDEKRKLRKKLSKIKKKEKLEKLKSERDDLKKKVKSEKEALKKLKKDNDDKDKEPIELKETVEEKRARLLKSNDPKELYDNKDLLTTAELNDRINRIDVEARLKSKIPTEPASTNSLNSNVNKVQNAISKATKMYKTVDEAYSTVANSAIGKTLAKKLGLEPPKKEFNLAEAWKNRNKLTNDEYNALTKRITNENLNRKNIESINAYDAKQTEAKNAEKAAKKAEKEAKKAEKEAQKQVDEYNKNWYENDNKNADSTYGMKGDEILDRTWGKPNQTRFLLTDSKNYASDGEKAAKKALKEAQKQVDEYNKNWYENDNKNTDSTYGMKGDEILDRTWAKPSPSRLLLTDSTNYSSAGEKAAKNTTALSIYTSSNTYLDKVSKGEKVAADILDRDGNVIARYDKNGKRIDGVTEAVVSRKGK